MKQNPHDTPHEQASYPYALRAEPKRDPTTIMTLSVVEISTYSAVGRRQWRQRGIGGSGVVVCNGRALSGPQTKRWRARRPSAPHDVTAAAATRQPTETAADVPQKKTCLLLPAQRRQPYPVFLGDTVVLTFKVKQNNCTQFTHHVKEAAAGP